MHPEAYAFVARTVAMLPPRRYVVDLGSRSINGSARALFPGALYIGVDIRPGRGVGVIANAADFTPREPADAVVCTEVMEHAPDAEAICANAWRILETGGVFVTTMAMDPRTPHSALSGLALEEHEYYRNVEPWDLERWLKAAGFRSPHIELEIDPGHGDLYAVAVKE